MRGSESVDEGLWLIANLDCLRLCSLASRRAARDLQDWCCSSLSCGRHNSAVKCKCIECLLRWLLIRDWKGKDAWTDQMWTGMRFGFRRVQQRRWIMAFCVGKSSESCFFHCVSVLQTWSVENSSLSLSLQLPPMLADTYSSTNHPSWNSDGHGGVGVTQFVWDY